MTAPGPKPRKIKKLEEEPEVDGAASDSDEDEQEDEVDETTGQALRELEKCQEQLEEMTEMAAKEYLQVETKYIQLRKPFYDKRAAAIDKVPNFWLNAIINHPHISMLIDDEEEECLQFLRKLEMEEFENIEDGFRLKFVFDENPFFENRELVKEIHTEPNSEVTCSSTRIKWKRKDLFSRIQSQIMKGRRKRGLERKTFFSWFSDNKDPEANDIAQLFKDDLWSDPYQFYISPNMDVSDSDEDSFDEDEEDEEAFLIEKEEFETTRDEDDSSGEEKEVKKEDSDT